MQNNKLLTQVEIIKPTLLSLKDKLYFYKYNENSMYALGFDPFMIKPDYFPLLEHRIRDKTALNALISLFILGNTLNYQSVRLAFDSKEIDNLFAIGILNNKFQKDKITSAVKISPYQGLCFINDFVIRMSVKMACKNKKRYDCVYPPNVDSISLADARIKGQFDSTLDLCTGCGIQAILASRNSKRVIGVDINPRAIKFANMNIIFNNINNVEFRPGDLYNPIGLEKFDYIIANPPFVISPKKTETFRDGGKRGDAIFNKIIFGLPLHLKENGYCQIVTFLGEFLHTSQTKLFERWVYKNKYDALLLVLDESDSYALAYGQSMNSIFDFKRYRKGITEYMKYLEKIELKKINLCIITIKNNLKCRFKKCKVNNVIQLNFRPIDKINKHYNECVPR